VERTRVIADQLRALGVQSVRRTEDGTVVAADCLLVDTTGELRDWYSVATIVFMGKSLTARGGQNPVEAIVADRPVIFGPHMENFAALARTLVAAGGALQPNDEAALTNTLGALLRNEGERQRLARQARGVLNTHHGATERTAALLEKLTARAA
jgi:3-deoxy-D-manno-octulosonic-acid transferase